MCEPLDVPVGEEECVGEVVPEELIVAEPVVLAELV